MIKIDDMKNNTSEVKHAFRQVLSNKKIKMKSVEQILNHNMCVGCGLCEAFGHKMKIDKRGFYRPCTNSTNRNLFDGRIAKSCPGIRVVNRNPGNTSVWGHIESVSNAWSMDSRIRQSSSSGGVISSLAIYLLESHKVDGVLHVGNIEGDYLHNKLFLSRTKEDVLKRNSSRYAPAAVFNEIFDILKIAENEKLAFIGKPCDIAAVRNLQEMYPELKTVIQYCLAIFCAGIPSYNATDKAISIFNHEGIPISIRYRGDGWPGFFTVDYTDGSCFKMSYNESWGEILGRDLEFRCKICPDGIGLLADVACGDAWNTSNGYPDFTEAAGRNFCMIRTKLGLQLFCEAKNAGYIESEEVDIDEIHKMQPYQYQRRFNVGWSIMAVQLVTNQLLNFKGLGCYRMAMRKNWIKGLKYAKGTFDRFVKNKKI